MTDPTGAASGPDPSIRPARPSGPTRRELAQRAQRRRSAAIATVSTLVLFGAVALVVVRSPGWDEVRRSFFSREDFRESMGDIAPAFATNVRIFLIAEVLILALSLAVAVARSSRGPVLFPVRVLAAIYVDLFRGIPILLLIFLLGFGVPALRLEGVSNDPILWATVALVLSYSAYVSEVFRAGIDSVHESQWGAARSLGLSSGQALRFVVLPQAVRRVIPPLLNDFIALQKETALVGVLGPIEAARQAQIYSARTFNFTSYVAAAMLFLAITIPLTRLADWLTSRRREQISGGRLA